MKRIYTNQVSDKYELFDQTVPEHLRSPPCSMAKIAVPRPTLVYRLSIYSEISHRARVTVKRPEWNNASVKPLNAWHALTTLVLLAFCTLCTSAYDIETVP